MLIPVLTASNAVAAGRMMRITLLVPIGATTTRTTATTILASAWPCAPRAHTNGVNRPYRVQETCGMDSGYPCSCAVMIRAVQIKGRNCRQNCEWRTVSGFFTQAERDMSCAKEEETS